MIFMMSVYFVIIWLLAIYRITKVFAYRKILLSMIDNRIKKEIKNNTLANVEWRFYLFNEISCNKMIFQFWKPVESFYDLSRFKL